MKILFKVSCLIVSFMAVYGQAYSQTRADMEMGEILNSGDLFLLKERYPQLKDSVSVEMLNLVAEAQLGIGFNRLESAATALDSLLRFHQDELGEETSLGMAASRAMNLLNLGRYAEAGEAGGDLVAALEDVLPFESLYSFIFIERVGKALANVPAHYVERPPYDVSVPMQSETVGKGHHIYIPVEVNGVKRDYIFDTGCSFGNFVSEKYAEEAGLEIVADSIPVSGIEVGYVKLATADSMKIGDIVCHNPVFMVAPPDGQVDSVFTFDGVLGYHFIRDVREVVIDNAAGAFLFPYRIAEGEPNMFLSSNVPNVRIEYCSRPLDMVFDTGNVKSDLGTGFASKFPDALSGLEEHTVRRGGFGGISQVRAVTLPEFCFSLSGTPVTLYGTEVIGTDGGSQLLSGSLGADMVLSFRRLTINYDNMYVRGDR